jgi:hypothetical protein
MLNVAARLSPNPSGKTSEPRLALESAQSFGSGIKLFASSFGLGRLLRGFLGRFVGLAARRYGRLPCRHGGLRSRGHGRSRKTETALDLAQKDPAFVVSGYNSEFQGNACRESPHLTGRSPAGITGTGCHASSSLRVGMMPGPAVRTGMRGVQAGRE